MGKPMAPIAPDPKDAAKYEKLFGVECPYCGTISGVANGRRCVSCGAPFENVKIAGNLS